MDAIKHLLKQPPRPQPRSSERGDLLQYFTDRINERRKGTKFKPLTIRAIAVKLSHLGLRDLYYLKSVCDEAERRGYPWAAIFWKEITPKTS